jgi:hypothetical protein
LTCARDSLPTYLPSPPYMVSALELNNRAFFPFFPWINIHRRTSMRQHDTVGMSTFSADDKFVGMTKSPITSIRISIEGETPHLTVPQVGNISPCAVVGLSPRTHTQTQTHIHIRGTHTNTHTYTQSGVPSSPSISSHTHSHTHTYTCCLLARRRSPSVYTGARMVIPT